MNKETRAIATKTVPSPIGRITLAATAQGLAFVQLAKSVTRPCRTAVGTNTSALPHLEAAAHALEEYFSHKRTTFDDLVLAPDGTPFQRRVWKALRSVPYGATFTYGQIARKIGRPGAARAVGQANNRNPIAIIVPCHRVIGADGSLTGYGAGLDAKAWLLDHEGVDL